MSQLTALPDALPDVLGDESLHETSAKVDDLRRQVASCSVLFLTLDTASLKRARDIILQRIQNHYQQASSDEKLLAAAYDGPAKEVSGQNEKAIQDNTFEASGG